MIGTSETLAAFRIRFFLLRQRSSYGIKAIGMRRCVIVNKLTPEAFCNTDWRPMTEFPTHIVGSPSKTLLSKCPGHDMFLYIAHYAHVHNNTSSLCTSVTYKRTACYHVLVRSAHQMHFTVPSPTPFAIILCPRFGDRCSPGRSG